MRFGPLDVRCPTCHVGQDARCRDLRCTLHPRPTKHAHAARQAVADEVTVRAQMDPLPIERTA